jgi:hypothetical protein
VSKTWVGQNAVSLGTAPAFEAYTGVRLWYDDENCFFAGDETGRVMEADCPWATQAMAKNVLDSIDGFVYQPFEAGTALLDMEAELGDGVTVGGIYGPLAFINTSFGGLCASDLAAPSDEEVDHEYPFQTKQQRELARRVTLGRSYYGTRITRQNGLEVVKTTEDGTESARVRLNSNVLAFYDANGREALYFDPVAKKYRFRGDVDILGGTMNVNDNFIVDKDGNLTINGNINLSGGSITWGKNAPDTVPGYIKSSYIDNVEIRSPILTGNNIRALQAFSVGVYEDKEFIPYGHVGLATGMNLAGERTPGVAMADAGTLEDGMIVYESYGRYVIVTSGGVRLQAGYNNVTLTEWGIYLAIKSGSDTVIHRLCVEPDGLWWEVGETRYKIAGDSGLIVA